MSHFAVYVFTKENGKSVDELLAPYNECIEYAPYVQYTKEQAVEKVKKEIEDYKNSPLYKEYLLDPKAYKEKHNNLDHIKYLEEEFPKKLKWTDDECYEYMKAWYENDMVDKNGNLLSTYNPNSKWDWYEIGGRWDGELINREGKNTNIDYANQIDWDKTGVPFAFIEPNGVWHEKGEMGWWAIVSNEKEQDSWKEEFENFVKDLDDEVEVTIVDCHI